MDFSIPDRIQDLLPAIRQFIDDEVIPLEKLFLAEGFNATLPRLEELRSAVKSRGWWLPQIPDGEGGMGVGLLGYGLLSAEIGRSMLGHFSFNSQAPDAGNMEILLQHGSEHQRRAFLEPLLRGDIRSCFAMTEPAHAGSNPIWLSTTAVADADHYVLNGHKWYVSAADGAAFAIVMALTDPEAAPH